MDILVSINCITYNHENYIASAIDSFLMQKTDFEFEIIIGEDCSTDKTGSIIEEYQAKYPSIIRVVTSSQNVGMHQNSRRVYEASRGKYIAICEGDDYWIDQYKLQKQVEYLEKNMNCTLCFHSGRVVDYNGKETGRILIPTKGFRGQFYHRKNWKYTAGEILLLNDFPTNSIVYRKQCLENMPEWCDNAPAGDISVKFLATLQGFAYFIDEPMSAYRYHVPGSCTDKWNKMDSEAKIRGFKQFIELLNRFDAYSSGNFSRELSAFKMLRIISIFELEGKQSEICKNENFAAFYHYLSFPLKVKEFIRCHLPRLFSVIKKSYKIMKKE